MALELMLEHWNETKAHPPWAPEDLAKKVENTWRYADHPAGVANPPAAFEPIPGAGPPVLDAAMRTLPAPIRPPTWFLSRVARVAKVGSAERAVGTVFVRACRTRGIQSDIK